AEAVHRPALQKIQIALAVLVRHPGALTLHKDEVRPRGDGHQCMNGVVGKCHGALQSGSGYGRSGMSGLSKLIGEPIRQIKKPRSLPRGSSTCLIYNTQETVSRAAPGRATW